MPNPPPTTPWSVIVAGASRSSPGAALPDCENPKSFSSVAPNDSHERSVKIVVPSGPAHLRIVCADAADGIAAASGASSSGMTTSGKRRVREAFMVRCRGRIPGPHYPYRVRTDA